MILGEQRRPNQTVHVPTWPLPDDPTIDIYSPFSLTPLSVNSDSNANSGEYSPYYLPDSLCAFRRYLPSNEDDPESDSEVSGRESDAPVDSYSCDHFRMFEFKVRKCARGRSHDWTECPYAHPGEKARRRDPRKYHYSGTACPEFRKGNCKKGDACEFAHGVFECWLHPARYRTQPCKDGTNCRRRVCFFAHTPEQLRVFTQQGPSPTQTTQSYDGSPLRQAIEASNIKSLPYLTSPSSVSPTGSPRLESRPMSPLSQLGQPLSRSLGSNPNTINEMVASLRNLQIGKVKSLPSSRNAQMGSPVFGSQRGSVFGSGFCSLPTTPTQAPTRSGIRYLDIWDVSCEEEPPMERVESGRDLRVKMFEKLSRENSMNRVDSDPSSGSVGQDVGWVSELLK